MARQPAGLRPSAFLLILLALLSVLAPSRLRAQSGPVFNPATGHWCEAVAVGAGITWTAAKAAAEGRQFQGTPGYLATPTSAEENLWMVTNLPTAVSNKYWVGGVQPAGSAEPDGGWQWITGEPWSYPYWEPTQPDDAGAGGLAYWDSNRWQDAPQGANKAGYVVEYGTAPPLVPPITFVRSNLDVWAPGDLACFDFDQDGNPDLAVATMNPALGNTANNDVALLYGHGDGTFDPPHFLGMGAPPTQTVATDVNGDGKLDVVATASDSVYVLRALGNRTYAPAVRYVCAQWSYGFQPVDLNGDQRPDLAVVDTDRHKLVVLLNNGSGAYLAPTTYGVGSFPSRVAIADWNGDGRPDVAVSNLTSDSVSLFKSNGNGTLTANGSVATNGGYPSQIVTRDFDGDGILDLVTGNTFGHTIGLMFGNGNGTFRATIIYPGNTYPHYLQAPDLDGDGDPDVATPNNGTDYFSVLRNTGGVLGPPLTFLAGGDNTRTLATGDFDLDGRADVAVGCESSHTIGIFLNATPAPLPAAPQNLTATAVSASRIDLGWQDQSSSETGFLIERKSSGNFAQIATAPAVSATGGAGSFTDTAGLQPNTTYSYRVRASGPSGNSGYSNTASATTVPPLLEAPANLTAAAVSLSQITLSWQDNSSSEDGFAIERKTTGSFAPLATAPAKAGTGGTASFSDTTSLQPNTTYSYRVRAINSLGSSAYSNTASASTTPPQPGAPTLLTVTAVTFAQVTLAWQDNSAGEDGFEIERKTENGAYTLIAGVGVNVTGYTDNGVSELTSYTYRVRAVNAGGASAYSNEASATTPLQPMLAPSNLTAGAVASTEIRLAWTDNSANETGFKIERKVSGGVYAQLAISPAHTGTGAGISYTDTSALQPNTGYVYRVRAAGSNGDSAYSNEAGVTTVPLPPGAPSGLAVANTSATTLNLSWTDNSTNETGFKVERRTGAGPFTFIGQAPADTATFQDAGLAADTLYTYRVRATGTAGDSANSNEAASSTPPTAPSNLTASGAVAGQITLTWTDTSQSETGFKIERKAGGSYGALVTAPANSTVFADTGLNPHTAYTYRIRATNAGGDSAYSGEAAVLTLPATPTALSVTALSSSQLELSWIDGNPSPPSVKVERSADGGANFVQVGTTAGGTTTYRDSGLATVTTYQYRVRASNTSGDSGYSGTASGTTLPAPPATPSGLSAVAQSAGTVLITWQDNSGTETGFEIYRLGPVGGYELLTTTGSNATSYTDTTTQGSTGYSYRMRAVNAGGASTFTGVVSVTTPAPVPPVPGGVAAGATSSQQIRVSWNDATVLETGFRIERKPSGGAFAVLATTAANAVEYLDSGLTEATAYTYRVTALGSSGNSAPSGEVTATTLLGPPAGLAVTAAANRINLAWQDGSTHETGFLIERKTAGGSFTTLASVGASVTAYADTAVTANTTYTYRVKAMGSAGGSSYSNESSAAPLNVAPLAKLAVAPSKVNFGTVRVGATKLKTVKLTNKGKEPLTATVGLVGAPFAVVSGGGSVTLAPKQSLTVTLRYAPTAAGEVASALRITSTVPATPQVDVVLSGKGK